MADNELDIYIRMITQQTGEKPEEVLKKLKEQVKDTGKEAVKAEEAVQEATDLTMTKKKELKTAIKQLTGEFPILGQVARLALNPVALAASGISAAFYIWKLRVDGLVRSLGGIEMPDVSTGAVERTNNMATAWGKLAQSMADSANPSGKIDANLKSILKTIESNDALFKAMGIDTGASAAQQKSDVLLSAADQKEAAGRARIARAGRVGSPESEQEVLNRSNTAAEAARKEIAAAEKRKNAILNMVDAGLTDNPAALEGMLDTERRTISEQQGIIDSNIRLKLNLASRDVRRKEISGGKTDIESAMGMREQALESTRGARDTLMRSGFSGANAAAGNMQGVFGIAAEAAKLAQSMQEIAAAVIEIRRANAIAQQLGNKRNQQQ